MAGMTPTGLKPLLVDDCDCEGPFTKALFDRGEDIVEGVSGRRKIDDTYENLNSNLISVASVPADKTF